MKHNTEDKQERARFKEIYETYYEPLGKYLNCFTPDVKLIEDIIQEIFVRLWEIRSEIAITYIKTYLFHAARNKILNYLRDEANRSTLLEQWFNEQLYHPLPEQEVFDIDRFFEKLKEGIDQLPEKCREIFIMNKIENLSYRQIAEQKGISVKTVENQMGIALKKLRIHLGPYYKYLLFGWIFIK